MYKQFIMTDADVPLTDFNKYFVTDQGAYRVLYLSLLFNVCAFLKNQKCIPITIQTDLESIYQLITLGKKLPHAHELINFLYKKPSVTATEVEAVLNVTPKTANTILADFVHLGILHETTGGKRNRHFIFEEYLKLFY